MSALPQARYGLDKLYLLPYYSTREAYELATGQPCPPWDATKRPKKWFDPKAAAETEDFVVYERVLATNMKEGGQALCGPDGKPYLKSLIIPREIAATVNIPPNTANIVGAEVPEYQVPVRALEPEEELFFDILATVMVRNVSLDKGTAQNPNVFTVADRALLQRIAAKLGA